MYRVAVVTGSRAEYGLLRPVLREMEACGSIEPHLLVTGAHLSREYGYTVNEIEKDGFVIAARLDILSQKAPAGRAGTAWRTALAMGMFLEELVAEPSDALLALGDRYEMLAAGQAAALLDIPVVHISGGDVTAGADDDWFRHCLTKMAKLHFPSCEAYRQRVIRMGEQPAMVHNVGGLGDENIRKTELLSREALAGDVDAALMGSYGLVTLHPETAGCPLSPTQQAETLLDVLEEHPDLFWLFTAANADAGGAQINAAIEVFCKRHANTKMVASLGVLRYLSAMKHARLVVGNSSSGVVETPTLGVPTVDIGNRQAGRVTGENVVHCAMESTAIKAAVAQALTPDFAHIAHATQSPYNGGDTSEKIVDILATALNEGLLRGPKIFYDGEAGK